MKKTKKQNKQKLSGCSQTACRPSNVAKSQHNCFSQPPSLPRIPTNDAPPHYPPIFARAVLRAIRSKVAAKAEEEAQPLALCVGTRGPSVWRRLFFFSLLTRRSEGGRAVLRAEISQRRSASDTRSAAPWPRGPVAPWRDNQRVAAKPLMVGSGRRGNMKRYDSAQGWGSGAGNSAAAVLWTFGATAHCKQLLGTQCVCYSARRTRDQFSQPSSVSAGAPSGLFAKIFFGI